jgi:predicted nucleic acid-binding protein
MIICDSDTLIDYLNSTSARHKNTVSIIESNIRIENVLVSVISKMELLAGATNKKQQNEIVKHLNGFSTALINDKVATKAFELFLKYHLSHKLMIPDAIIAATAIEADVPLFTYNLKDFKFINGLKLFKP